MGGRINTIMQTCFFAISGVLPRDGSHRGDQALDQEDLRQARRSGRAEELRGGGRDAGQPARGEGARRPSPARSTCARRCRPQAPEFVQKRDSRRSSPGRWRLLPVSALPDRRHVPHRHDAVGKAQHRAGNSGVGRGDLHPVRQVRPGLPARRASAPRFTIRHMLPRRARDVQERRRPLEGIPGHEVHAAGRAGRLHRLRAVRRGLPGQEQEQGASTRPSTWRRSRRCAKQRSARNWDFFLNAAGDRPRASSASNQVKDVAAAAAAVRVLRRLRGLRRDALREAGHPVLRRPRDRSPTPPAARRSTAATCRPRRTRSTSDGRGPAWSNSLFEDNAEFGLGIRLTIDKQTRIRPRAGQAARAHDRRRAGGKRC